LLFVARLQQNRPGKNNGGKQERLLHLISPMRDFDA
jgi:hypothetical protein